MGGEARGACTAQRRFVILPRNTNGRGMAPGRWRPECSYRTIMSGCGPKAVARRKRGSVHAMQMSGACVADDHRLDSIDTVHTDNLGVRYHRHLGVIRTLSAKHATKSRRHSRVAISQTTSTRSPRRTARMAASSTPSSLPVRTISTVELFTVRSRIDSRAATPSDDSRQEP